MPKLHAVPLALAKSGNTTIWLRALNEIASSGRPPPSGMRLQAGEHGEKLFYISRSAFVFEQDALVVYKLPHLNLAKAFLGALGSVVELEIRVQGSSLTAAFICTHHRPLNAKDALSAYKKSSLPPGIHNAAALVMTKDVPVRTVSGGLPSLGKKR